jgi:hypothetical protein
MLFGCPLVGAFWLWHAREKEGEILDARKARYRENPSDCRGASAQALLAFLGEA